MQSFGDYESSSGMGDSSGGGSLQSSPVIGGASQSQPTTAQSRPMRNAKFSAIEQMSALKLGPGYTVQQNTYQNPTPAQFYNQSNVGRGPGRGNSSGM